MRDRQLVEKVQSYSKSGLKNHEISKLLDISTSNVSRWCRKAEVITKPTTNSTYHERIRYQYYSNNSVIIRSIDNNMASILLSILYWCEGAKYPGTNRIDFVSSDENMQQAFIKLFRLVFAEEIDESKFRVMLQLHYSHNISKTTKYWSKLLNIPSNQFIKPNITKGKSSRYRHVYNGTCSLRYYDYRFLLRIMGIYDQLSNKILAQLI